MGTYLVTGIVQEIAIDKRRIKYSDISIDNIIQQLKKELNLNCYNHNEDQDGYYWKIKPEVLEGDLAGFIDTQFQMYTSKKDSDMQKVIEILKKTTNVAQILELASNRDLVHFQLVNNIIEHIKVVRDNGFDVNFMVYYSLIAYFLDGKIIMECYGNILRYLEYNIRLQKNKYAIVDCVKVMITS